MSPTATYTQTTYGPENVSIALKAVESIENAGATDTALAEMQRTLNSTEVKQSAVQAIKHLTSMVADIRRANRRIREDILHFDTARFVGLDGKVVVLGSEWDGISRRFDEYLNISQLNATEASAFMKQYSRAILEDVGPEDIPDIKLELQSFAKQLSERVEKARANQVNFESLSKDVSLFKVKITVAIEAAGAPFKNSLAAAKENLERIEAQVKVLSDKISAISRATTELLSTGAGAVAAVIHTLAPDAILLVVDTVFRLAGNGITFMTLRMELSRTKPALEKAREEVQRCEKDHEQFMKYAKQLAGTQEEIDGLVDKLDVLAHIWQHLQCDMNELKEQLDLVAGPGSATTKRFFRKLDGTRELYKQLTQMLDDYARGVEDSKK